MAVLTLGRRTNFSAEVVDDEMESIADTKNGNAQSQHVRVRAGRVVIVNRRGAAGKDQSNGMMGLNFAKRSRAGQHHGENI